MHVFDKSIDIEGRYKRGNMYITTDKISRGIVYIYKRINDRVTHIKMRTQLRLDFLDFSHSVSSTDG